MSKPIDIICIMDRSGSITLYRGDRDAKGAN